LSADESSPVIHELNSYENTKWLTYYLTHQLTSWIKYLVEEMAVNSASQVILLLPWNLKVYYYFHRSPIPVCILSHMNPVHTPNSMPLKSTLILSFNLVLGL
jgi:hypothetical protein